MLLRPIFLLCRRALPLSTRTRKMSANPVTVPVLDVQALSSVINPGGELPNKPVPGAKEYYPLSDPAIGSALDAVCRRHSVHPMTQADSVSFTVTVPTSRTTGLGEFIFETIISLQLSMLIELRCDRNKNLPKLFQPIKLRNVTFKNRIWVVRIRTSHAIVPQCTLS